MFLGRLKFGEFRRCAFNSNFVLCQGVLEAAGKTRTDGIKSIVLAKFELGIDLRSEPGLIQSLKSVIASRIIRVKAVLIPSYCAVLRIILHRFSRGCDVSRFPQGRAI